MTDACTPQNEPVRLRSEPAEGHKDACGSREAESEPQVCPKCRTASTRIEDAHRQDGECRRWWACGSYYDPWATPQYRHSPVCYDARIAELEAECVKWELSMCDVLDERPSLLPILFRKRQIYMQSSGPDDTTGRDDMRALLRVLVKGGD